MRKLLGERLHLDWKVAVVIVYSTIVLILDSYHVEFAPWEKWLPFWNSTGLSSKVIDRNIIFLILPLFIILVIFREKPSTYGFGLGDWKAGLVITLIGIVLIAPILWLIVRGSSTMQVYYEPYIGLVPWNTLLDLFCWEFFFRGFLLFGLGRKLGAEAIWLQAVPFALAHIGKPELETLSTIFGGFAFGWVAWRTKSFLYPFLIHWFVGSFTILLAVWMLR